MNIKKLILTVVTVLLLPVISFSAINVNINSGNPTMPFPQFINYDAGGATYTVYSLADAAHTATGLALHQPDGVSLAEMEQWIRDAWKIHSNEFSYNGTVTYQNATGGSVTVNLIQDSSSPYCSEGHGYALLAAALICDKDAFDGLWCFLNENVGFYNTYKYSTGVWLPRGDNYGNHIPGWQLLNQAPGNNADSATDGDDDIAMAALLAWKQWGDNSGYYAAGGTGPVNSNGLPEIQYKQMALDMLRFMVEKDVDLNGKYTSGDIGYDGYHKGGNTWHEATPWYTGPDTLEFGGPQTQGWFDYAAPAYFHAFGNVLQANGYPVWDYNQYAKGEASDDWLMGQLASNAAYKNTTAGQFTVTGSTATFFNANMGGEDFRAPWRTGLNYLWNGNPATSWDPVNHVTITASNQYEYNAAMKEAQFVGNPQLYGTGVGCESYGSSPVTYQGVASLQNYNLDGTKQADNWHVVYELAAPSAAVVASQNFDEMGELFREIAINWDQVGGTDNYLGSIPHYFHGFFRQLGLMVLTGNMLNPVDWNPEPNMRVFTSLNKTYSFTGDTVTFWINYRNYGSIDATGVQIIDTLPSAFSYVSTGTTGAPSVAGQVVTWNIPAGVPGLHNQNYSATEGGVTLVAQVKTTAAQGRYCNFADISCTNGTGSTSSPFPNDITTIMSRTCVDIVAAALTITKTAGASTTYVGQTITYTINYCNSSTAGWINGGRSGINFSFGLKSLPGAASGDLDFYLRANHEAAEPMIDWANYRFSYFLNSPYSGSNWTVSYYNAEGFNSTPPLITTESFAACSPTACSDGTGSWNQRVMLQFGNFGTSTAEPTHFLFWKTGTPSAIHFTTQTYPFFLEADVTAAWANQNWTDDWSQQAAWAVTGQAGALFPISPDWTRGDGTSIPVTKINKDACEAESNTVTSVLIEEWDGYTWRRVFGNGPMPGREVDNVHVIDSLPTYLSFGGVVSAPAGVTFTPSGKSLDWNIGTLQVNQCGQIKYWVNVLSPGCPAGNGTVENNDSYIVGDKEAAVYSTVGVTILCGSPTNTPTFGASSTFTRTPTYTATFTPTATATYTATSTATSTGTYTPTNTSTYTGTSTPTSTATYTMTPSNTASPTYTWSATNTATPSATASSTYTATPTDTKSDTPTLTVTDTESSNTPTDTPTYTATPSASPTYTSTGTPTNTPTDTGTYTATNTYTDTPTYTATSTMTESVTYTKTVSSDTPTFSPTFTNTVTESQTWTATQSATESATYTSSETSTDTPTASYSVTQSETQSATPTYTQTMTYTDTPSQTETKTDTATWTDTATYTSTATYTATYTVTSTPMPSPVDLDRTLTTTGEAPKVGAIVTFTMHIENSTNETVNNIEMWDTLPPGMSYTGNPDTAETIQPTVTGNYLSWDLTIDPSTGLPFSLGPHQMVDIEFTAVITDIDPANMPFTDSFGVDYNDPMWTPAIGKHPPLYSKDSFYPEGDPVVYPNPYDISSGEPLIFENVVPGSLIQIYTLSGERVAAIQAPSIKVTWDGRNGMGRKVSSGIYYFVIHNQSTGQVKKGKLFVVGGNK